MRKQQRSLFGITSEVILKVGDIYHVSCIYEHESIPGFDVVYKGTSGPSDLTRFLPMNALNRKQKWSEQTIKAQSPD